MPIEQTGSVTWFTAVSGTSNETGTVSSTISVPADTIKVIGTVSGYHGTNNGLASMTFTQGGADVAMTKVAGGDASAGTWQGAMFWMDNPDTGSNKSWKWDWVGGAVQPAFQFGISFWKGCDTGIRDDDGAQAGSFPVSTATLTAQSGDKIFAVCNYFCASGECTVDSWSNLTLLENGPHASEADAALATNDPSGNVSVGASTTTGGSEPGICALVMTPAAAGGDISIAWITA